jgi:opacity protein-like surface antigen
MKKLLVILGFLPLIAGAQNFYASARLGMANYQGDLKASSFSFAQSKLLLSLGARYDFSEHVTARSYFTMTALHADDKNGTASMKDRNLNFRSKIFDWELAGQYNFFSFNEKWWTPYISAGIGFFHFNPYTNDTSGNKVYLKPLSTEGEGFMTGTKNYKLWQFSIPLAIGAEYSLNEDMRVGFEFGYRKIFTDYLDDVSTNYVDQSALLAARGQTAVDLAWRGYEKSGLSYPPAGTNRGNPKYKDGYYFLAITYSMRLVFDQYKDSRVTVGQETKKIGLPRIKGALSPVHHSLFFACLPAGRFSIRYSAREAVFCRT